MSAAASLPASLAPAAAGAGSADGVSLLLQRVLSSWLRGSWPSAWQRSPAVTSGADASRSCLASASRRQAAGERCAEALKDEEQAAKDHQQRQEQSEAAPNLEDILDQPLVSPLLQTIAEVTPRSNGAPAADEAAPAAAPPVRRTRRKRGGGGDADQASASDLAPTSSSTSASSSSSTSSSPFLAVRFPVVLSSLCVEFELTRYTRLGTRVIFRAPGARADPRLQPGVYLPAADSDTDDALQYAAADSHGFVTLESVWPAAATPDSDPTARTFTASLAELLDVLRDFYTAPFTNLEWRFLRSAVAAGTLSRTDPGVEELLMPEPVVAAQPTWPQLQVNWPESAITRALELMGLSTSGTVIEKAMRIWTEESVGGEKAGTDQNFGLSVNVKLVVEARAAGKPLPIDLEVTSDWSAEDISLLACALWSAHPLADDPDRPIMLQREKGRAATLHMVPYQFAGGVALPLVWSYQEFLTSVAGRRPDVTAKIEAALAEVHRQRLEKANSPGARAQAKTGKRGGKARRGQAAAAASASAADSSSSGASTSAPSTSVDREPCDRHLLLGGRQRLALVDVTTATVAHLPAAAAAAGGQPARLPVDIKIDIELE